MVRKTLLTTSALVSSLLAAQAAFAQSDSGGVETVTVTAERVTEDLQHTAASVTALSTTALNNSHILNSQDLQAVVPTLSVSSPAGSAFIYLRGIGTAAYGVFSDNSVATYVDGVYVPKQENAVQSLFDLKDVEVLKGPQASLYGRNAMGGVITINSADPTDFFTESAEVQYGNYDSQLYRGYISGPLSSDGSLTGRLSIDKESHDGYSVNLTNGHRFDSSDSLGLRGKLIWDASSKLTFSLVLDYNNQTASPGTNVAVSANSLAFFPAPNGFASPFTTNPRAGYHNIDEKSPSNSEGGMLKAEWDVDFATLTSVTGDHTYKLGPVWSDIEDSNPAALEYQGEKQTTKFFSQDLYLTSKPESGPFQWLFGGTYTDTSIGSVLPVLAPAGPPPFTAVGTSSGSSKDTAYAAYAQATYAFTDQFKALVGARLSSETLSGSAIASVGAPSVSNKKTWTDFSPKASLQYDPTDHLMFYVSATKGFKSGIFSPLNPLNIGSPETLWSYEAGMRSTWFDNRLQLNLSGFHYDYKNNQIFGGEITGLEVLPVVQNASGATINGLEFEPVVAITDNFKVGASATYLDATYNSGTLQDLSNSTPGFVTFPPLVFHPPVIPSFNVGGNEMINAPKLAASIFADLHVDLNKYGSLDFHAGYFYSAHRYFSAFEDPTLEAKAYNTVDLRLAYNLPFEGNWYVAGYGRNIGNTLVTTNMSRVPPFGTLANYAPPALYGIEIGEKY